MADNIRFQGEGWLRLEMTAGIGLVSGNVAGIGNALVVDLITDADAAGVATVMLPCSYVVERPVVGADGLGNAAISIGDALYLDGANVNADATNGVFYGYALAGVASGATATIQIARAVADNREGWLRLELTVGAGAKSGDVVAISELAVDCITDADSSNKATVMFPAAYATKVAVTGKDASANAVVNIGDKLYKDGTEINKDATNGVFYGYALAGVASGATATILVARAG